VEAAAALGRERTTLQRDREAQEEAWMDVSGRIESLDADSAA
jgi:hypothetical protein